MASFSVPVSSPLIVFLRKHAPSSLPSAPSASTSDYTVSAISDAHFPSIQYTETEKEQQSSWLTTASHIASPGEDQAKTAERLAHLNVHLATRTTALGSKPSVADIALYARLADIVKGWSRDERTGERGYHHIVRHVAFVQGSPIFGLSMTEQDKVPIDEDDVVAPLKPIDAKAEKERKKKEKEAATGAATAVAETNGAPADASAGASGGRKAKKEAKAAAAAATTATPAAQGAGVTAAAVATDATQTLDGGTAKKKEKTPKAKKPPEPAKETPLTPALIDLRVGHILKAERHPNADSLYVSTIACGDAPGSDNTSEYEGQVVRTVCSGLNGLVPLEEMQNRMVLTVCNLKPVKMRGVLSAAMVLAASPRVAEGEDSHGGPVELVAPPPGSAAGDRACFEGWEGEPEGQLNPKKKIWEMCQAGFTTTGDCEVAFDAGAVSALEGKTGIGKLKTVKGLCAVPSLKDATVR